MNGKLAKKIRKQVYGPDGAPRLREYLIRMPRGFRPDMKVEEVLELIRKQGRTDVGQILADKKRQIYQLTKKMAREKNHGK
ncbi:MAG: hypothetical protein EHM49_01950 [Deltaproteobacteria bacterium]|nr:MAG: hypothetical protein EHM49_01950 [Deltaproteobacteria bacterium]